MANPRETFDRELKRLHNQVLYMGEEVSGSLIKATHALVARDVRRSRQVIEVDEWVNENRIQVMLDCFTLIATQAPAASDMRFPSCGSAWISISSGMPDLRYYVLLLL